MYVSVYRSHRQLPNLFSFFFFLFVQRDGFKQSDVSLVQKETHAGEPSWLCHISSSWVAFIYIFMHVYKNRSDRTPNTKGKLTFLYEVTDLSDACLCFSFFFFLFVFVSPTCTFSFFLNVCHAHSPSKSSCDRPSVRFKWGMYNACQYESSCVIQDVIWEIQMHLPWLYVFKTFGKWKKKKN